jgi:hypothetical protein
LPFVVLAAAIVVFSGPQLLDASSSEAIVGSDGPIPKCNGENTSTTKCPLSGGYTCGPDYQKLNDAQKLKYFTKGAQFCTYRTGCPTDIYTWDPYGTMGCEWP